MRTLFWRSLVVIFVILGFIGALLPGMPTTVFQYVRMNDQVYHVPNLAYIQSTMGL